MDPRDALLHAHRLNTELGDQFDKLAKVVGRMSTVTSIVNVV